MKGAAHHLLHCVLMFSLVSSDDSIADSVAAYDGFGNQVEWFFVLKLPKSTFPATNLWHVEASQGFVDISSLELTDAHCDCPDPTCEDAPFPEYGQYKGKGLCYLYADSNNPKLRYFRDVKDAEGNALDCLGQGGRDPLSVTLKTGIYSGLRYRDPLVEWAFWNDDFSGTSNSYTQSVCAYSSYSEEALPYTPCSSTAQCGSRCSGSPYASCSSDGDCGSGQACKQIKCASRALPHYSSSCGSPYGHSKGCMAYESAKTGFFLQGSTPNWPDPSLGNVFAPLGCQLDNNTYLSQNFMGFTFKAETFQAMAPLLESARLCSTNTNSCKNGTAGHLLDYTCTSEHTRLEEWSILNTAFNGNSVADMHSASLVLPTARVLNGVLNGVAHNENHKATASSKSPPPRQAAGNTTAGGCCHYDDASCDPGDVCCLSGCDDPAACSYTEAGCSGAYGSMHKCVWTGDECVVQPDSDDDSDDDDSDGGDDGAVVGTQEVTLVAHCANDAVPPWLVCAHELETDLGVANWWEFQYGQASICKGDDYSNATNAMCLVSDALGLALDPTTGGAARSVENAIAASFTINGVDLAWGLWGEFESINSHAKFGVASTLDPAQAWVVGGDQNNQGFSCSATCQGSQNGRGGLFFGLKSPALHSGLYKVLKIVCACNDLTSPQGRFCYFGCYRKDTSAWLLEAPIPNQASSFWDADQKSWYG